MGDAPSNDTFLGIIDYLTADARQSLADSICTLPGLGAGESAILAREAQQALRDNAERKLNRILLLELHAAKLSGQLSAADESGKFAQFLQLATQDAFKDTLRRRYPVLEARLQRALGQQSKAIVDLARRIVADRDALAEIGRAHV